MTDSVEARDVIAEWDERRHPGHDYDIENYHASDLLAALSEHGYTVIRTDPETMAKLRRLLVSEFGGPSGPPSDSKRWDTAVDRALVVLRGDPQ